MQAFGHFVIFCFAALNETIITRSTPKVKTIVPKDN